MPVIHLPSPWWARLSEKQLSVASEILRNTSIIDSRSERAKIDAAIRFYQHSLSLSLSLTLSLSYTHTHAHTHTISLQPLPLFHELRRPHCNWGGGLHSGLKETVFHLQAGVPFFRGADRWSEVKRCQKPPECLAS
uniref:Uncharacterized protein n=1 Tax=Micrurus spixii TaxID=129469 RepID=A0A2D4MWX5_9SAUR